MERTYRDFPNSMKATFKKGSVLIIGNFDVFVNCQLCGNGEFEFFVNSMVRLAVPYRSRNLLGGEGWRSGAGEGNRTLYTLITTMNK